MYKYLFSIDVTLTSISVLVRVRVAASDLLRIISCLMCAYYSICICEIRQSTNQRLSVFLVSHTLRSLLPPTAIPPTTTTTTNQCANSPAASSAYLPYLKSSRVPLAAWLLLPLPLPFTLNLHIDYNHSITRHPWIWLPCRPVHLTIPLSRPPKTR